MSLTAKAIITSAAHFGICDIAGRTWYLPELGFCPPQSTEQPTHDDTIGHDDALFGGCDDDGHFHR